MSKLNFLLNNITELESKLNSLYQQLVLEKADISNSIVATAPNIVAIIQDEKFVFINSNGAKLLQFKNPNDITGKSIYDIIHHDSHSAIKKRLHSLKKNNTNTPLHIKLRKLNHKYLDLEANSTPIVFNNQPASLIVGRDITNELLQKQNLVEERNLRDEVLNSFNELITYYDNNHNIRWMNNAAKEFYGLTNDTYVGKKCYQVKHNRTEPCYDCPLKKHPTETCERIVHDKEIIWLSRYTPIKDMQGNIAGYMDYGIDVTENEKKKAAQIKAEKELIESEQRFREIFENSNDYIFVNEVTDNLRFRYLDFNPAFEQISGFKRSDLIGKYPEQVFPPELAKKRIQLYRQCVNTKKAILNTEIQNEHAKLAQSFLLSLIPITNQDGKVYRILGIIRDITERKQTEETLLKRERDFRTLAENAPDPIYRYDRKCRRIYINPIVEKVGKIPIESLLGKTPADGGLVSPKESMKVMRSLKKVLKTGEKDIIEVLFVSPDGRELWIQNIHVPEFGNDGTVESVLSIGRDITERKQLEQHLKKSFLFIEKIISSIPEPIFIKDRKHRFILINDAFCSFSELASEELIGKTDFDFYQKNEARKFWEEEEENFISGQESITENVITNNKGNKSFIVIRKVAFTGTDGKEYLAGTINDITERKNSEILLHRREQEFRTLVENSPDIIVRYDTKGKRLYFNPAFQKLADFQASVLLGSSTAELSPLPPDLTSKYIDTINKVIDTALPQSMDIQLSSSGSELYYNMKAVPEFDKDGKIISVLAIARDVSELKRTKQMSEMLSFALDNASDAIFITEYNIPNFIYVNNQASSSLGYSKEELLNKTIFDIDPNITPEMIKQFNTNLESGNPSVVESWHKAKDGSLFPVNVTTTLYHYNNKPYIMNIVTDITELKQAEDVLRESEKKFSTIFRLSPASLSITRLKDNVFIDVNDVFLQSTGLSRNEVVGFNQYELNLGIDINTFEPLRSIGDVQNFEYHFINRKGETEYGLLSLANITLGGEPCVLSQSVMITELKQAEKLLQQREQEYRTLVENSPDIITRFDLNYKRVYFNKAFLKITEYSANELKGTTPEELSPYPPYAATLLQNLLAKVISSSSADTIDLLLPCENGDLWFNIRAVPEFGNDDRIESVMTISKDITELKKKQKDLIEANRIIKESEQRYRLVFENSPVSIWEEDFSAIKVLFNELKAKGIDDIEIYFEQHPEVVQTCVEMVKIVDVNDSALILHEASSKHDLLTNLTNTFTPQSFETFKQELIGIWNGKTKMASDAVVKTLSGNKKDVTVYFNIVPGYEKSLSKILVSLVDITERKQAEFALRESEQRFREMFDNSHDSIYLLEVLEGSHFRLLDVNPQYEKEVGIDREKHIGRTTEENAGKEVAAIVNKKYQRCVDAGTMIEGTIELEMPQGMRTYHSSLVPIRNKSGKIYRIMGLTRDVTEEVKAKQELEASQERLEKAELFASIGHIEFDFKNDVNYWSEGAYEIFSLPVELRVSGNNEFINRIHPDDRERVKIAMKKSAKELSKFDEIYRISDYTGTEKVIHGFGHVMIDEKGIPGNFLGIIQDITLTYELNAQVQAEEEKFRILAESSPVGIYISIEKTPVYANKPMLEIVGVDSLKSLKKINLIDLVLPEDRVKVNLLNEKLKKNDSIEFPLKLSLRKLSDEGTIRHYNIHITTFKMKDVKHLQFIVIDKTEDFENEKIKQQLTASALYIDQKIKIASEIESHLKNIIASNRKFEKVNFQPLVDVLRSYSLADKDWELLNNHMKNIYPEFVSNLKKYCSSLTVNDIKHCACIKLNMDTKEIARLFNVKASSIQTSRVRLKKKLNLDESTDLRDFILNI